MLSRKRRSILRRAATARGAPLNMQQRGDLEHLIVRRHCRSRRHVCVVKGVRAKGYVEHILFGASRHAILSALHKAVSYVWMSRCQGYPHVAVNEAERKRQGEDLVYWCLVEMKWNKER